MSLSIKQLDKNPWEEVNQQFKVDQKIKGNISNITDFGIFVQLLPGIDGLVHISDLSWTEHVEHPGDRYKLGDEVEAVVLTIDINNKKISLGIKQLTTDPWEKVEEQYPIGTIVEGEINKITNFGAFIKLPSGIEGLIHNTILTQEQGKKAEEFFKTSEKVKFRVINVNKNERKLGLSTKLEAEAPKSKQPKKTPKPIREKKTEARVPAAPKTKGSLRLALESALQKEEPAEEKKDG